MFTDKSFKPTWTTMKKNWKMWILDDLENFVQEVDQNLTWRACGFSVTFYSSRPLHRLNTVGNDSKYENYQFWKNTKKKSTFPTFWYIVFVGLRSPAFRGKKTLFDTKTPMRFLNRFGALNDLWRIPFLQIDFVSITCSNSLSSRKFFTSSLTELSH